jgi:hypothetical protein
MWAYAVQGQPPSSPDMVARYVAVAAIVVSLSTLAFNIYSWTRNGPRIKVVMNDTAAPEDGWITLRVTNDGRLLARIDTVGLRIKTGSLIIQRYAIVEVSSIFEGTVVPFATKFPHTISDNDSGNVRFHLGQVYPNARVNQGIDVARQYEALVFVRLKTSKSIKAKRGKSTMKLRRAARIAVRIKERADQLEEQMTKPGSQITKNGTADAG